MDSKNKTDAVSTDEADYTVRNLTARPTGENYTKFLSAAGRQIDLNPEFQFIDAKAKVVLGTADSTAWTFLLNYFESKGSIYAAICSAEALLLEDDNSDAVMRYDRLMAKYTSVKEKELSLIRQAFTDNPPERTISVIMPTYNRAQYIKRAIESVLNQTFKDFEIIIVNDGGSRECEAVIESFHSDKIRYLYVEHGGLSHALNQGILASRSKYIAYLDDDDQYFPDHLQNLVTALESSSFAYTDARRIVKVYIDGEWKHKSEAVEFSYDFDPGRFAENNYIPILCMAHRRDCFENVGLFERDLPNAMDWDLWTKAARSYDFQHINKVTCMYEYRLGPDSLSGRQLDNLFFSILLRKHNSYLAGKVWSELSSKAGSGLIDYDDIEGGISRYCSDKCQLAEWLLPFAFAHGKRNRAYSLITQMTRNNPSEAFFTIWRLGRKIPFFVRIIALAGILTKMVLNVFKRRTGKMLNLIFKRKDGTDS